MLQSKLFKHANKFVLASIIFIIIIYFIVPNSLSIFVENKNMDSLMSSWVGIIIVLSLTLYSFIKMFIIPYIPIFQTGLEMEIFEYMVFVFQVSVSFIITYNFSKKYDITYKYQLFIFYMLYLSVSLGYSVFISPR